MASDYQNRLRYEELLNKAVESRTAAEENELKLLEAYTEKLDQAASKAEDLTSALSKQLKYTEQQTKAFRGVVNAFSPLNEKAGELYDTISALNDPLSAGFKLIELSVKRFVELDNAARAFRDTTGFLSSQTKEVETNIRQSSRDLAEFGVSVEVAKESATALASAFGDTAIVNKENLEYVSLMKQNLGITAEDSTALLQNFMGLGGMTSQVARETAGAAASLSKAAGVPFKEVMSAVAKPSGEVRALIRGSVDALIKGAIEAKRLGTSLESVGKAAAGMLDFQSSINDEMEASVLFGKDVNLQKARELSYAGDLKGVAKEQVRLLQEAGDVSKMDFFQRQGIAKALGMSVEEMDKMNSKQKELNELKIKDPALYAKYTANLDVLDKTNESLSEKYQKELKSQQIASQQEKIMNSINSMMTELADALLPVINTLVPILGVLLKISVVLIKLILAPFRLLNDAIDHFFKTFSGAKQLFDDFGNMVNQFFSSMLNPESLGGKVTLFVVGLATLIGGIMQGGTIMGMLSTAITAPFKFAFKLLPNYFKGAIKTATDAAKNVASTASSSIQTATSGIGGKGVLPTAGGPTPGGTAGGGGGSKFMDTIKGIKPTQLLSLGVAMLAFAGAMYILAKAGQEFNTVDWSSLGKMAAAAVVMGVTLGILATVMAPLQPILWPLVGVMLAFGAAMLAVGYSTKLFGEGFALMNDLDLMNIGLGLYTLSGAVLAFGTAMAGGGMLSFLGGGMMLQLVALAAISPALNNASMALSSIGSTLQMFKDAAVVEGIENITEAIKGLNKEINNVNLLNVAGLALLSGTAKGVAGGGGGGDEVVAKLDELIGLMRNGGIAVNIDGSKVSTAVGVATKFRGAF